VIVAREQTGLKSPILTRAGRTMSNRAGLLWLGLAAFAIVPLPLLLAQDSGPPQARVPAGLERDEAIFSRAADQTPQNARPAESVPDQSVGSGQLPIRPVPVAGRNSSSEAEGVANDWSNHHLIFSRPGTPERASRVEQDPRYWQQLQRNQLSSRSQLPQSDLARPFWPRPGGGGGGGGTNPPPVPTHSDWSENLGGNGTGAGTFPAKYSFMLTTAHCASDPKPDFVVYATGLPGSSIQASIVAYDNLYAGCTGTVPSVYWAYNTGTSARIVTSPAFSRDGTQVAFVQTDGSGSSLVLLKWAASTTETVGGPETLIAVLPSLYSGCPAPCMTTFQLANGVTPATDTNSSVFLDLSNDTAWVGDDNGVLHKFSPVFFGTALNPPAEITTGGFPVQVNPGAPAPLSSPVHDYGSGNVFVGDIVNLTGGGFLYRVDSSSGAVTQSGQLDFGVGITEGPVVDSTAGLVYVFSSEDGTAGCNGFTTDCTGVWQLPVNFASGDQGQEAVVGNSIAEGAAFPPSQMYVGAFDNTYENSIDGTGNLYVCGNTGANPIMYQVPIAAGVFGTAVTGPTLSDAYTPCSPVTDVYNPNAAGGPSEFFFVSMTEDGISAGCATGGCIYNFNDTPWKANTFYQVGQEILDPHLRIQVVKHQGTSGGSTPPWTNAPAGQTLDGAGGLSWINQGLLTSTTPAAWQPNTAYALHALVLDSNGNIEIVTTAGHSGPGPAPTWKTTPAAVTIDTGGMPTPARWTNLGAIATAALAETDGTSGIIIDNTVGSGTIVGGSQIYFSTLGNQTCGTSGGGRCAVQASQSALQ